VGDADAARYGAALASLTADAADALLVILTAQATVDAQAVAHVIATRVKDWPIPVTAAFVGGPHVAGARAILEGAGLPCYPFPERAAQALGRAVELRERRASRLRSGPTELPACVRQHLEALRRHRPRALGMRELAPALEAAGIPVVPTRFSPTAAEAAAGAAAVGTPAVLKIVSPDVSHKTEVGGVQLGLSSPDAVGIAAEAMLATVRGHRPHARIDGFLVQRMAHDGHELLLGMVRDAQFGPLVLVGFGGIYVEVLSDTSARLAPVTSDEAAEMLDELKMAPVLRGARGRASVDRAGLAAVVARFSALAAEAADLAELEINPLVVGPAGVTAVDARATLEPGLIAAP
jgi:acetyltransferase